MASNLRNFSILSLGQVGQKAIGFVAMIFYARLLHPEELALIPMYGILSELALILFGFGIQAYVFRELPKILHIDADQSSVLIRKSLQMAYLAGLLMALSLAGIAYYYSVIPGMANIGQASAYMIAVACFFECVTIMQQRIQTAASMFLVVAVTGLIKSVIRPIVLLGLFYFYKLDGFVAGFLITSIINYFITHITLKDYLKNTYTSHLGFLEIIRKSWPYYLESFVMFMRRQGDQILVSAVLGPAALGIYFVARRLYELLWVIVSSADSVVTPALSRAYSHGVSRFNHGLNDLFVFAAYMAIPVILFMSAMVPLYIHVLSAEKYSDAQLIAVVLMVRLIPDLLRGVVIGRGVFVVCEPAQRLSFTLLDTLVLLPAMYVGLVFYGMEGMIAGTFVSAMVSGYYGVTLMNKVAQTELKFVQPTIAMLAFLLSGMVSVAVQVIQDDVYIAAPVSVVLSQFVYILLLVNFVHKAEFERVLAYFVPAHAARITAYIYKLRLYRRA